MPIRGGGSETGSHWQRTAHGEQHGEQGANLGVMQVAISAVPVLYW